MDDTCSMGARQRVSDGYGVVHGIIEGHFAGNYEFVQRRAADVLHDEVTYTVVVRDVVERNNIWMIQSRCCSCLLHEATLTLRVGCLFSRQYLDRDSSMQACIPRAVHFTHAAAAN